MECFLDRIILSYENNANVSNKIQDYKIPQLRFYDSSSVKCSTVKKKTCHQ